MYNTCDVCGKEKTWCEHLQEGYTVHGIDNICEPCCTKINNYCRVIREKHRNIEKTQVKEFIKTLSTNNTDKDENNIIRYIAVGIIIACFWIYVFYG